MVTRVVARYIRITPRKFRQIIPMIKGKNPELALAILMNVNKKAAQCGIEVLKSAIANVKRIPDMDPSTVYISKVVADCGPQLKRFRAASMGRASTIRKRTSHITLEIEQAPAEQAAGKRAAAGKAAHEAPAKEASAKKHKARPEAKKAKPRHEAKKGK
ncbi:MAG: 50S ribosomal protein L22 [Candidatus Omnitrophica bacterium]|nr:50S ribosomal protein L22 [Candidatus Omnitrophota bacterium]